MSKYLQVELEKMPSGFFLLDKVHIEYPLQGNNIQVQKSFIVASYTRGILLKVVFEGEKVVEDFARYLNSLMTPDDSIVPILWEESLSPTLTVENPDITCKQSDTSLPELQHESDEENFLDVTENDSFDEREFIYKSKRGYPSLDAFNGIHIGDNIWVPIQYLPISKEIISVCQSLNVHYWPARVTTENNHLYLYSFPEVKIDL